MGWKYIILGNNNPAPIIFTDVITHEQVAFGRFVKSAGFCDFDYEGAKCWGESISLGIKSNPDEDAEIIEQQFRLGKYRYI